MSQDLQEVQSVTMLGFDGTALWGSKAKARDRGPGREMCLCAPGIPFPLAAQHGSAEEAPGTLSTLTGELVMLDLRIPGHCTLPLLG